MVLPNFLVFRKLTLLRYLMVSLFLFLNVAIWFPSHTSAQSSQEPILPAAQGPLTTTTPFRRETSNFTSAGNYLRLTAYSWTLDPIGDGDPALDYYVVFVSGTTQANGTSFTGSDGQTETQNSWCISDGRPLSIIGSSPSQRVTVTAQTGSILSETIKPVTGDRGAPLGSDSVGLGLDLSSAGLPGSISWSEDRTIFEWTMDVSSTSSQVSWAATKSGGPSFGPASIAGCDSNAWIWGYAVGLAVPEGQNPVVDISLGAGFFLCQRKVVFGIVSSVCEINPLPDYDAGSTTRNISITNLHLSSGSEVVFETNPLVGSIAFRGTSGSFTTEFSNGEHSFFAAGKYSAAAIPPEDYIFDHWECPDQYHRECGDPSSITLQVGPGVPESGNPAKSNPAIVNVQGNGVLKAVFAAKLTFLTDPPDIGSIMYDPGSTCLAETLQSHPDGDWVYVSALPPDNEGPVNNGLVAEYVCTVTPAGYRFDHWSTTARLIATTHTGGLPDVNQAILALSGPNTIKAWFSPVPTGPSDPTAPSDLVAIGQYDHVDLTWKPPLSDGGSPVTGYEVYRGDSFAGLSLLDSIGNQFWYQDTSGTNGQIYYYRVTAVNLAGEGPSSNTDSARPGIDRITIAPDPRSVLTGAQVQFSAFARAESGEIIQGVSFSWTTSVPGASITNAGLFKAGTIIGTFTEEVSASAAGVNGYATVIVQAPPGTRSGTANLSFDSLGPWTWMLIPGAVAAAIGVLGFVVYRKKLNRRLSIGGPELEER